MKKHETEGRQQEESPVQKDRLLAISCIIGFCLIFSFFIFTLISRKVFILDDLGAFHLPTRDFFSKCLQFGWDPTWFPGLYCGFNLHGEGQLGMYHPLHWLLYRLLPLDIAFNLEMSLSYLFMFFGMYFFLKSLSLMRGPASLGALVFTFSGVNLMHHMHLTMLSVVSYLPWNLFFLNILTSTRKSVNQRLLSGLFLCLFTASQMHMGYPHYLFLCQLLEIIYLCFHLKPFKNIGSFFFIAWMKFLSLVIGSLQLIPTWESFKLSKRDSVAEDFLYTFSLEPENLIQFFSPYFFSSRAIGENIHESSIYCGTFSLISLLYVLFNRKKIGTHWPLGRFCLLLFLFSIILSLGKLGLLYSLQIKIPLLNIFRCPARYILFCHFAFAIFCAICLHHQLKSNKVESSSRLLIPLIIASLVCFFYGYLTDSNSLTYLISAPLLFLFSGGLFVLLNKKNQWAFALLPLFIAIDQGYYGLSYVFAKPPLSIDNFLESLPKPPETGHRISATENAYTMLGYRLVRGYVAAKPKKQITSSGFKLAQAAGVEWSSINKENTRWKQTSPVIARCQLISRTFFSTNPNDDIEKIDLMTSALVEKRIDLIENSPGIVRITRDLPGDFSAQTNCSSEQLLIFCESYHDDWTVTVNNQSAGVLRVNGDFLGCVVPAGLSEVSFKFESKTEKTGKLLSLMGLVALALTIVIIKFRKLLNQHTP